MTRKLTGRVAVTGVFALVLTGCWASKSDHRALSQRVDQIWDGMVMHQKTLQEWRDWHTNTEMAAWTWVVDCLQNKSSLPCSGGPGIKPPPDSLPRNWP